jgi:putative endonuclease
VYYIYILESEKNGRFYVGYSEDPNRRLSNHNTGKVKSTRPYRPWKKVYEEAFESESEARNRESYLKSMKSRAFILRLIGRHVPIENRDG